MTCLKCGRETDQTFCESCREVMEKYPVKSGTIILLPKEREKPGRKQSLPRRNVVTSEVKIAGQRRIIRRLAGAVASLLVLLCVMGFALFQVVHNSSVRRVGQNYSAPPRSTGETTAAPTMEQETTEAETTEPQTAPEAQTEEETE